MPAVDDPLWGTHDRGALIDRVHELEGLLASTTRRLERTDRELAAALEPDSQDRASLLGEQVMPEHLVRLDNAIERLAIYLTGADGDNDLWLASPAGESRLAVLANAIGNLAAARDRLTPRPLPVR